jgi:hypothetical protein
LNIPPSPAHSHFCVLRNKHRPHQVTSSVAPLVKRRAQHSEEIMRNSAIAIFAVISLTSHALADGEGAATPSLRQIVDEIAATGSALVHNGSSTVRLVRDQNQCALGEQLALVWINFADARAASHRLHLPTHYRLMSPPRHRERRSDAAADCPPTPLSRRPASDEARSSSFGCSRSVVHRRLPAKLSAGVCARKRLK